MVRTGTVEGKTSVRRLALGVSLLFVIVAAVVLVACGGSGDGNGIDADTGAFTFVADDGSASLVVPAEALPPDVSPGDVRVIRITEDEVAEGTGSLENTAVYSLEPDGIQLGEGAVLTTDVHTVGYLPIALQIGSGAMPVEGSDESFPFTFGVVEGTSVIYDVDLETATVSVPIRHFSTLTVQAKEDYSFFQITPTRGEAVIGQKPDARATVIQNTNNLTSGDYPGENSWLIHFSDYEGWPRWFYLPVDEYQHFKEDDGKKGTLSLRFAIVPGSATISGKTRPAYKTEVLEPKRTIRDRPPLTRLSEQYTILNTDFTCSTVGRGRLAFDFRLEWEETRELQRAWDPTWRKISNRHNSVDVTVLALVDCTDPSVTTSSSTTSTTSSSTTSTTTALGALTTQPVSVAVSVSIGITFDPAGHGSFVGMPNELMLQVHYGSITVEGPAPFVTVTGDVDADGRFSAVGIGTVAGFSNISVTMAGSVTPDGLDAEYSMGTEGGLPTGQAITYSMVGTPIVAAPVDGTADIEAFYENLNEAQGAGDATAMAELLHPAVFDLYGSEQCSTYLTGIVNPAVVFTPVEVLDFGAWRWERDGVSTSVDDAFAVMVNATVNGEDQGSVEAHIAYNGDDLAWFTDCGEPLNS